LQRPNALISAAQAALEDRDKVILFERSGVDQFLCNEALTELYREAESVRTRADESNSS
jgi:hypothetical protein